MKWKILVIVLGVIGIAYWQWKEVEEQSITEIGNREAVITVAATIYPLATLADELGVGYVNAISIIPPGVDPHTFEPSPQDIANLQNVDLVFVVGLGFDDWILKYVPSSAKIVDLSDRINLQNQEGERLTKEKIAEIKANPALLTHSDKHEHPDDETDIEEHSYTIDPHYWLSPINAQVMAQHIRDTYADTDKEHGPAYTKGYYSFTGNIDSTLFNYDSVYAEMKGKKIITTHDGFNYFINGFGAQVVATVEPLSGQEPSPQYVAELIKTIQDNQIKVIFTQPQYSNKTAATIADQYDLQLIELDDLGGTEGRKTYIELLTYNLEQVSKILSESP